MFVKKTAEKAAFLWLGTGYLPFTYGTLPSVEYSDDGALVHIHMNYLLPPRELEFLKLYSWPERCTSFPCDFRRKLSTEVFFAIKNILSDEGYKFKEGIIG